MIIASDLDGVLCFNTLNRAAYRPFKMHEFYAQCQPAPCCSMHFQYIITARKIHFKKITERWLIENNIQYEKLFMFPNRIKKTYRNIVKFKANMINSLKIDVYYEDDLQIVEYLTSHCPNTEVVIV